MQALMKMRVFVSKNWQALLLVALIPMIAGVLFLTSSCSKTSQPSSSSETKPQPSAATQGAPSATPTASGSPATDEAAKRAAVEWALKEEQIKNDPNGQWAIGATASSTYNDAQGNSSWSANQVAGPPNVEKYADDGNAWAPKTQDGGIEWLDLKYVKPVHATELRVRESFGSGAVIKVELFDEHDVPHVVWTGTDSTTGLNYLDLKFPKTDYKTARVKVTLATNLVPGWNEVDAVQLVGTEQ
jgi:hypothetical protein